MLGRCMTDLRIPIVHLEDFHVVAWKSWKGSYTPGEALPGTFHLVRSSRDFHELDSKVFAATEMILLRLLEAVEW